jgi:hypothetical protein
MDYDKGYSSAIARAQRIRESTNQNKAAPKRYSLADKPYQNLVPAAPDLESVRANYIIDIQDMFLPMETEKASLQEVSDYLQVQEAVDTVNTQTENLNAPSAKTEGHMDNSFISKLIASESSGDPGAVHVTKEGKVYGGLVQLGEARLKDYNKATNSNVGMNDILSNVSVQRDAINWHLKDLETRAQKLASETGMDIQGLVAVGHLGGPTGMYKFATSGGKYNKKDELGTSLMDYYTRFKNK